MRLTRPIDCLKNIKSRLVKHCRDVFEYSAKQYPLRIVDEYRCMRRGITIFTVQIVGKRALTKLTANDICDDDNFIQGFAPHDVKRIVYASVVKTELTIVPSNQPVSCRIISKNLSLAKNRPSYTVEQTEDNQKITKTLDLDEVTRSKDLLLQFSKQDIFEIAYTAGATSILHAQEEIKPKD